MSRKMRMLLSAVALVAIVAMAWMFLISPLRTDISNANQSIADETTKLHAAEARLAQAQTTRAEGMKNQAVLLELAKMVPQASQIPSLLVQIQDLADQSGIDFLSVTPGDATESTGFQIIPLQLTFSGTYFDLSDFAYRVEQLAAGPGRLLTVKSVQLKLNSAGAPGASKKTGSAISESPSLDVSMTLYAFCMDQSTTASAGSTPAGQSTAGTTAGSTSN